MWQNPLFQTKYTGLNLLNDIIFSCVLGGGFEDAEHITAIKGESVILNCPVDFPEGRPVPYVINWRKQVCYGSLDLDSITLSQFNHRVL